MKLMYVASRRRMRRKANVQAELRHQFDQVRNNRLALFCTGVDRNARATRVIDQVV